MNRRLRAGFFAVSLILTLATAACGAEAKTEPRPPISAAQVIETATIKAGGKPGGATGGSEGAQLFSSSGCIGCHKVGGQGGAVGPDLSHIGTQAATLKPGMSAEDFIHESIVTPNAYVAEGFQPGIMPQTFGQTLQPEQIDALVKYLAEQK